MDVRSVIRITTFAAACTATAAIGLASVALAAQVKQLGNDQPSVGPKMMVMTILQSVTLTDDQRGAIKAIVEAHRTDIQAARQAQDPEALHGVMRQTMSQIIQTLTPEQRDALKAAMRKALAGQE